MRRSVLSVILLCGLLWTRSDVQTWRSANGHSFDGEFLGSAGGQVQLRGTDGNVVTVPLTVLDEESRARVAALSGDAPPDGLTANTALYSAKGDGYEYFVGKAPEEEYLQIRLYDGPDLIPHYGATNVRIILKKEVDTDGKPRQQSVELKEFVLEKETSRRAQFRLLYETGVEVVLETESVSSGVGLHRYIDKVPSDQPPHVLEVRVLYPALLEYDPADKLYKGVLSSEGVAFPQLAGFLNEYQISATRRGETLRFGFHESPDSLKGQEMVIETPARKDIVYRLEGRGEMSTRFYGGKKIIEGFGLNLRNHMKEGEEQPYFYITAE